ncbi:MAG: RHS repeat-associated core domain-containing protein, partial [Anaerolineaceae bacterium]|nr:RHS repeat-associated core domain-containing protein [Anaerolineaceae bacterium]
ARVLYYPYGEERYIEGTLQTDYGYTGQRKDSYLDTYHMGAREYDPRLGRWLSADNIVPDPANPQSLNRFSYVIGNPLKYADPSGHLYLDDPIADSNRSLDWRYAQGKVTPYEATLVEFSRLLAKIAQGEKHYGCGTLGECHGGARTDRDDDHQYVPLEPYETISEDAFNGLLEAVHQDLKTEFTIRAWPGSQAGYIPGALAGRGWYDTPLWDGDQEDTVVCIEGYKCSRRSHVNYIAQGMWGARAGETLEETLEVVNWWNQYKYGHPADPDELYWAEVWWRWEKARMEEENQHSMELLEEASEILGIYGSP